MEYLDNPLLAKATISGDRAPIQRSTCSDKPRQTLPPSKIRDLVARLGLRYRPTSQTDIEAHTASLALLAQDLADIPPDLLERAIGRWVVEKPFMPKAAELVAIAKQIIAPAPGRQQGERIPASILAERYNADPQHNPRLRWVAVGDELRLEAA